jgi:hypothetical protein
MMVVSTIDSATSVDNGCCPASHGVAVKNKETFGNSHDFAVFRNYQQLDEQSKILKTKAT